MRTLGCSMMLRGASLVAVLLLSGFARAQSVLNVPSPTFPTIQSAIVAASVSGLACPPLIAANPAPWVSPFWSLSFPLTLTLQGLEADPSSGTVFATNALRVRVH